MASTPSKVNNFWKGLSSIRKQLIDFSEDVYGKEIIIVRNINANSGASTYKLKSEKGRVISSSRQDLNKLTLCLNIQVENPVLILNQDAARSFLRECDPKKMYTLFLKATQIEMIIEKLHACLKQAVTAKTQLEHLERSIKQYESEVAVIKDKHEKLQSVARLRREIVEHKNELDWFYVNAAEVKAGASASKLHTIREQIEKINDFVKNKSKYDKQLKEKIRDLGTEFAGLTNVVGEKDELSNQCRAEFERKREEVGSIETSYQTVLSRKATADQNVAQLVTDITEREENPTNVENIRKQNEVKIAALDKKIDDLKLIMGTATRDHGQFVETANDHRERVDNAKKQFNTERGRVEAINGQIRQIENSKEEALSAYGRTMTQLVNRITELHKRGKFAELPRGPIGRYIEVTDKKYKSAVENYLAGTLTSFFVSCDKDRIQLTQVLKEFPEFSRTTIITSAFHHKVYDVRDGKAQIDHSVGRVLMDGIKVSDPAVMNLLIDQKLIDTVVFVDSTETAIELTQDIENVPHNLKRVVLLKPYSEYYPAPSYRSYAMTEKPVRYIQTNFKELVESYKAQKVIHETKMSQITSLIQDLQLKAREKEQLVQEKKRLINDLQQKERQYQHNLAELKAIEYPAENEIEFLRKELEDLIKKQKAMGRKVSELENKLQEEKEACAQKEAALKKTRDDARASRDKMTAIQREIENTQHQLQDMGNDMTLKLNQKTELHELERDAATQASADASVVGALSSKAVGQRVAVNRSEDVIKQTISFIEIRIRQIESNNDNIDDVGALLESKVQQVDKMTKIHDAMQQVMTTLEGIRTSRFHYIKRLRQHMSIRCKHKFHVLMALRNYSAEVEIDHQQKTLSLKVIPRDAAVTDAVSNTKSLSGGERSYSTVSFLIALWSCVDHPFYFLDEYDVFSDEHNRHMMTMLLFNEAEKKREKQYGFLTPQDFSNIEASDTITIHRLDDPDRLK